MVSWLVNWEYGSDWSKSSIYNYRHRDCIITMREHFSEKLGNEKSVWKIYTENSWASVEGLAISKALELSSLIWQFPIFIDPWLLWIREKSHQYNTWCVEQNNQATNINVGNNYKHKQNYKTAIKRKNTRNLKFVYLVWGESIPSFHCNDEEQLYKEI